MNDSGQVAGLEAKLAASEDRALEIHLSYERAVSSFSLLLADKAIRSQPGPSLPGREGMEKSRSTNSRSTSPTPHRSPQGSPHPHADSNAGVVKIGVGSDSAVEMGPEELRDYKSMETAMKEHLER